MNKKPRAIDLFAGAGGLTEGLRQAGYKVVGAVENDPIACLTYRKNHPSTKLWEKDIRTLTSTSILTQLDLRPGELDLLAACPPCQGFSSMRTKNGSRRNRDERNDLVFEITRLIRSLRPKSVMIENVPGLANNRRFKEMLSELRQLRYKIVWDVLNAADYAVPQRRKRLILLASRIALPEFAPLEPAKKTVRQAIGKLAAPKNSSDTLHNYTQSRSKRIKTLINKIPKNGGSRRSLPLADQLQCHQRAEGFNDVYGRMTWNKPSPTITGGCTNPSKGRFLHPTANRAITLREAALLQTFPPDYYFPVHKGRDSVALLIGNALPPEFIRRHARELLKIKVKK